MTKYIIVVGGVMSGVGKGVSTASLGKILQEYGFSVTAVKIDPYLNYDAGTLRPTEHGEVWVTDDGGEIDQDLGNYERFFGVDISKINNITSGQIYKEVIDRERRGEYLGKTVQFIPHIPEEIQRRVQDAGKGHDFAMVEIGGTIGDYENQAFLFAMKSLQRKLGRENVIYVLVTYMVTPRHMEEMKTKPTQQAIKMLHEAAGIFPDFILCRAHIPLDDIRKKKIETYANIASNCVISEPDVKTIYQIPLDLEQEKMGLKICEKANITPKKTPDWTAWNALVEKIIQPEKKVKVALVGKYVDVGKFTLADSYVSINEALKHAGANTSTGVEIEWIDAKSLEQDKEKIEALKNYAGIIIPGGFGSSGIEGKINAIKYAREKNIPFLGLCYGMQLALIEFARNKCHLHDANSTEINPETPHPIIALLPSQEAIMKEKQYGGTMRLGAYSAHLKPGSNVEALYKKTGRLAEDQKRLDALKELEQEQFRLGKEDAGSRILERHRHRYEVSPKYKEQLEKSGMHFAGHHTRKDGAQLMEFIELKDHPFFMATQGHPEFKSRLEDPAPLFLGFIEACNKKEV